MPLVSTRLGYIFKKWQFKVILECARVHVVLCIWQDQVKTWLIGKAAGENCIYLSCILHRYSLCSLDPLARGPLGPRTGGSKLYKNQGLIWTER